jgi:hypothetical protein
MKAAIFLTVFLMTGGGVAAQGKFAPPQMKSWIGKVIADETELPGFSEYQSRGGSVITDADDPEPLSVNWFSKPNSIVVFFEQTEPGQKFTIVDVLEIKNTTQGQEIKAGDCRDGESDNSGIVALVQPSSAKRVKAIRAWLFNRDKKRIEAWSAQNVTCLGMVGED